MRKPRPRTRSRSIEFPYALRRDGRHRQYYPVVEAGIQAGNAVYPIRLLLDSGADCTMLPKSLGELVGVDFRRLSKLSVTGVEGRGVKAFLGSVTLRIGELVLPPIPCLFARSDRTPFLLGREGFFDLFDVMFDNRHKKVVLTRLF